MKSNIEGNCIICNKSILTYTKDIKKQLCSDCLCSELSQLTKDGYLKIVEKNKYCITSKGRKFIRG